VTGEPVAAIGVTASGLGVQLNAQGKARAQTTLTAVASAVVASAQAAAATSSSGASTAPLRRRLLQPSDALCAHSRSLFSPSGAVGLRHGVYASVALRLLA
jgi:hypothetical protein